MNYELAKELKEAGFPPEKANMAYSRMIRRDGWYLETRGMIEQNQNNFCGEILPAPTLEELIEACGEKLMSLHRTVPPQGMGNYWCAEAYFETGPDDEPRGSQTGLGSNPTEAVANLWLALNKK